MADWREKHKSVPARLTYIEDIIKRHQVCHIQRSERLAANRSAWRTQNPNEMLMTREREKKVTNTQFFSCN